MTYGVFLFGGMKMTAETVNFETVARIHMSAPPDRQKNGLRAWLAALIPESYQEPDEQLLYLKEVAI